MLINLFIWAFASLVFSSQTAPVYASEISEKKEIELPIKVELIEPVKLSSELTGVKFVSLELKKAAKVLSASIDVEALLSKYSSEYGIDKNLLSKIANCESHYHTTSVNGDYGGMFQFSTGTWIGTRNQMGLDSNPELRFSGEEAIRTAAFKISRGGVSAWANCAK